MRIDAALRQARERLAASPSASLDAQLLLCHVLVRPRSYLFTWPERELDVQQQQRFLALLTRREQGEPVAHLTGEREFFGRRFTVTADTLIPRPDTETLVELALQLGPAGPARVVDLGTGTGAIGLSLALERPQWQVTLVDLSAEALSVAQRNARDLSARVTLQQGNWLQGCDGPFDLIVSNPPWGRQTAKADRPFLDAILSSGLPAHLLHSAEASHIEPLFEASDWSTERYGEADFALPAAYSHHSRQRGRTRAAFWRLVPP